MTTAIASVTETTSASPDITATHPSNIVVGDMLIASIGCVTAGTNGHDYSTPSGWTQLVGLGGTNNNPVLYIFAKIAESGDISGSTAFVTLGETGEMKNVAAHVARITGTNGFLSVSDNIISTGLFLNTPYSLAGVTTIADNSILLMCGQTEFVGDLNFTTQAVFNNNPTWTEEVETYNVQSGSVGDNQFLASATYATEGATGNFSFTITGGSPSVANGALIAITESINVTVSPSVIAKTASVQTPNVEPGALVEPAVIQKTASVQDPTVTTADSKWTNTDKSSAPSWTNENKS